MGPVLDLKGRKETTMEASASEEHIAVVQMPKDKNMRSEGNHEGKFDMRTALGEQDLEICKKEEVEVEVEVDIINCMTNDDEGTSVQPQSEDATGSSSSFGDTFSEVGSREYGSDDEVMSGLRVDAAPTRGFGGSGDLFPPRKKRLTSHWRKFIQPIMWRCKWVELQIKKFQSQAIKYDKQLKKHYQTEPVKHGNFELEGLCAKSMPFSHNSQREKPMKRKKRKRHEESDTEVYMAQHNLFSSTIGNGGGTMDDDQTNLATSTDKNVNNEFRVPDELLSLEFRDDYFLEQMLWKIEVAQSQVCEMKTRLNTVMTENTGRFEDLNLLESNNALTCSVRESGSPRNRDGPSVVAAIASELMKYNTGDDSVKPENATSSHGEETQLHDINEQMEQPPVASRKRSTDGILIYNRRAKKPQTDSGAVKIHPIEKLQQPKEKADNAGPISVSEDSSQNEQPAPKLRSVSKLTAPNNKKKRAARARRKGGSSLWSRRTSGLIT
ncbi:hypothetical protein Ccrd_024495 [Cynara cardunculus var. scolymus]|uniref:Uncharacterized protein n=1 Tax=Cynara cardunculus var. scolymus TaxID=59895 RepID=A0A103XCC5_CYNCS|nr:hypothetical protein Ccrd_024495 [Cynara cardunculus var. scolymus]